MSSPFSRLDSAFSASSAFQLFPAAVRNPWAPGARVQLPSSFFGLQRQAEVAGTAADGRVALDKVRQVVPDVVLLDVEMPNMNGFETLNALRSTHPKLPVIMFSSLTKRGGGSYVGRTDARSERLRAKTS